VLGPGTVRAAASREGAGAGGGLAFALALLGARLRPGAALIAELAGLADLARTCDLLVTGGPALDPHALHDSAVPVVAGAGAEVAVPVVVVAEEVVLGRREWSAAGIAGAYAVAEDFDALDSARAEPWASLAARIERVAITWSR
uniref:glycerate kinase n=1 Tax=Actinotalea sp. TaxID=1872145 RepID=UPI003564C125